MKMMMVICVYVCALMGCSILEGYEFGDGTKVALSAKTIYCNALPQEVRDAALKRMQSTYNDYPDHSICDASGFIVDILTPLE